MQILHYDRSRAQMTKDIEGFIAEKVLMPGKICSIYCLIMMKYSLYIEMKAKLLWTKYYRYNDLEKADHHWTLLIDCWQCWICEGHVDSRILTFDYEIDNLCFVNPSKQQILELVVKQSLWQKYLSQNRDLKIWA